MESTGSVNDQLIALIALIISLAAIFYIYLGYPILISVLRFLFPRPVRKAEILPRVSLIIAAHNEENDIADKIRNSLSLDYPADRFEIIVASDSSTDATDQIVRSFESQGVILCRQEARRGKTRAQYNAALASKGEILVFSDATTLYARDALRKIVRSFADPEVGCVAGQLVYVREKTSSIDTGCRSYWNYEKVIKEHESRLGSLIGVSGCCYAVRRSCQAKLPPEMIDDFVIATEIHKLGLRTVYEPEALTLEETNSAVRDEFRMRVRIIEQTLRALVHYRNVFNKGDLFAFQMISHKMLRYSVPLWLLIALAANSYLAIDGGFFLYTLIIQLMGYSAAILGWLADRLGISVGLLSIPYYFMLVNVATVVAIFKFVIGDSHVVWEPNRKPKTVLTQR